MVGCRRLRPSSELGPRIKTHTICCDPLPQPSDPHQQPKPVSRESRTHAPRNRSNRTPLRRPLLSWLHRHSLTSEACTLVRAAGHFPPLTSRRPRALRASSAHRAPSPPWPRWRSAPRAPAPLRGLPPARRSPRPRPLLGLFRDVVIRDRLCAFEPPSHCLIIALLLLLRRHLAALRRRLRGERGSQAERLWQQEAGVGGV